jgi:hypothetical protein
VRPLRVLASGFGLLVVASILVARAALTPVAQQAVLKARGELPAPEPAIPPSPNARVRRARFTLGAAGLVVLLVGAWKVLHAVQPPNYVWLAVWLLGAILLNDAIIAPVVVVLRALLHRGQGRLPDPALGVLKAGFVVAGVLVLVVAPEIWAQHLGTANPTILPGNYLGRLLVVLAVIAGLTLATTLAVAVQARHRDQTR